MVLKDYVIKSNTVETNASVVVDIGMEHFGHKFDIGRFGRVLLSELQFELKQSTVPGGSLRPLDKCSPFVEVAFLRRGIDAFILFVAEFLQISDQSLLSGVAHHVALFYIIYHNQDKELILIS